MALIIGALLGVLAAQAFLWLLGWIISPWLRMLEDKEAEELRKKYGPYAITSLSI